MAPASHRDTKTNYRRRRRSPQFTLATLFLLTVAAAFLMGLVVWLGAGGAFAFVAYNIGVVVAIALVFGFTMVLLSQDGD